MFKKVIFFSLLFFCLSLFAFNFACAETTINVTNTGVPQINIYPSEFDQLVMDFTIAKSDGSTDTLNAITFKNTGTSRDFYEISKVTVWADAGRTGFQGMEIDEKLGDATYYSTGEYYYISGLTKTVPAGGLRIFVSIETTNKGSITADKTVQMKVPTLSDSNSNKQFDFGDTGIFLTGVSGPAAEILNSDYQLIKMSSYDSYSPKSVITSPADLATITTNSFKITGVSRDQGGSTPAWVKISINNVLYDVVNTGSNFSTWEYNWQNISDGSYTLKTQSQDWLGNTETAAYTITATVNTVVVPPITPEPIIIDYTAGTFIKISTNPAVFFLDASNVRHAYPTQKVYESYFGADFSFVATISDSVMASYVLGNNVPFKAGTLIKIPSVPKVYKVGNNSVIQWVETESAAQRLYGNNWASLIIDLPEAFFTDYTEGENII